MTTLPDVAQLIAAMPKELDDELAGADTLYRLTTPTGAAPQRVLARLWTLATLQAKIAVAYLAYWLRKGFAGADADGHALNEAHLAAALRLVSGMTYLRGPIMKVGQVLATYPNVLPAEYSNALASLQFHAAPMYYALIREQLRAELGGDPEEIFARFERQPFAAASLGQVHRASLAGGDEVAVKVQYPGLAKIIRADFRALKTALLPMRFTREWEHVRDQFDDAVRMVDRETDYEQEAAFLDVARETLRDETDIVVPRVFRDCSTSRVLTMEYLPGAHLDAFLERDPSQQERDRRGAQILRALVLLYYRRRLVYADVQPGNFLFMDDGRLGLIDFGSCRMLDDEEWRRVGDLHVAMQTSREETLRASARMVGADVDTMDPAWLSLLEEISVWLGATWLRPGPFDYGDAEYFNRGLRLYSEMAMRGYVGSMPVNLWYTRCFVGFRAIAYRLRARIDFYTIMQEELGRIGWLV